MGRHGYGCSVLGTEFCSKSLPKKLSQDQPMVQTLTVLVKSKAVQARSAGTPTELLNIAPSATESLDNIVDIIAEIMDVEDMVKAL